MPKSFENYLTEIENRRALAVGALEKLARRGAQGVLNARSRIDALLNAGSFIESAIFATYIGAEGLAIKPADGKVAGFGLIGGCPVAIVFLCDSFNIPLVFLVDQLGVLIGMEGEQQGVNDRVMNWMDANAVHRSEVICKAKSYGLANELFVMSVAVTVRAGCYKTKPRR